jgi:hypothetical protein
MVVNLFRGEIRVYCVFSPLFPLAKKTYQKAMFSEQSLYGNNLYSPQKILFKSPAKCIVFHLTGML